MTLETLKSAEPKLIHFELILNNHKIEYKTNEGPYIHEWQTLAASAIVELNGGIRLNADYISPAVISKIYDLVVEEALKQFAQSTENSTKP